jgi:polyphenol oxidase
VSGAPSASTVRHWRTPAGRVLVRSTAAIDGDFRVDGAARPLGEARALVRPGPWTWLRQEHGIEVVEVWEPGAAAGARADAAVTVRPHCTLSVTTADCAPLVLVAEQGVAVVHAGWRGAVAGVVEAAIDRLVALDAGRPVASWLGPCIGPAAYEFEGPGLAAAVDRFGEGVRSRTAAGAPALDLRAVVRGACRSAGWPVPAEPACTSDPRWFSHRTRGDRARQATVAWLEPVAG